MTRDSRPAGRRSRTPSSRPAAARRETTRPGERSATQGRIAGLARRTRRNPQSMRRLTILGALLLFLAVIITPTLNSYLQQRDQISQLGSQVTSQRASVTQQQAELKKWNDPIYIAAQAKTRLGFVKPGQTLTVLVDENGKPLPGSNPTGKTISKNPWYGQVWSSVVGANKAAK
ncbi:FtsB family cell division protein [Calidifontibacter terrae]